MRKILNGEGHPEARDRVEAAKALVMLDLALLKAEIETGMYKKPVEVLAREIYYEPLPPEVRAVVIAAWMLGDMLPKATVERMVPALEQPVSPSRVETTPHPAPGSIESEFPALSDRPPAPAGA